MASSRKTAVNENVSTYGTGKTYTVLATWEGDTDINLVSAAQSEVLECYDTDASFDDNVTLQGATTNSSYFRIIRPASGEGHDGTPNNGVHFISTTDANGFASWENNSQIQDIICTLTVNSVSNRYTFTCTATGNGFIGCMAVNGTNAGSGTAIGFVIQTASGTNVCVNGLAHNNDGHGFWGLNAGSHYFYNCTATNNTGNGFHSTTGTNVATNCLSSGHTNDWNGTWTQTTCSAEDASPTYANAAGDDFHLASTDTTWIDAGTDLSGDGTYAFDDDIDAVTITGTWDMGFDEYTSSSRRIMVISKLLESLPLSLGLIAGLGHKFISRDFEFLRGQK